MTENTEQAAVEQTSTKTVIRPNLNNYVRAKSGSGKRTHRIDDLVARTLDGKTVEQVVEGGTKLGINTAKWLHLNPGQQRMLVGNALRHAMNDTKEPLTAEKLASVFGEPAAPYDAEAAAAAKAAADAEKARKKAEKEAAKAKKAAGEASEAAAATNDAAEQAGEAAEQAAESSGRKRRTK